jgi:hypothetical protein
MRFKKIAIFCALLSVLATTAVAQVGDGNDQGELTLPPTQSVQQGELQIDPPKPPLRGESRVGKDESTASATEAPNESLRGEETTVEVSKESRPSVQRGSSRIEQPQKSEVQQKKGSASKKAEKPAKKAAQKTAKSQPIFKKGPVGPLEYVPVGIVLTALVVGGVAFFGMRR